MKTRALQRRRRLNKKKLNKEFNNNVDLVKVNLLHYITIDPLLWTWVSQRMVQKMAGTIISNGLSNEASSSKGNVTGNGSMSAANSSFTLAQDYIPFDFGDDDDEADENGKDEESKGVDEKEDHKKKKKSKKEKKKAKEAHSTTKDVEKKRKRDNTEDAQQRPSSSNQRKKEKRQMVSGTPWSVDVDFDRCLNAAESLHNELIAFADWISPTEKEHETRQMVIKLLRRAIVREWPDARLEAFGSQNTQLYMPSGDIDLVVVSPSMETQRKENVLRKMAAVLRKHNLALDVQVIAKILHGDSYTELEQAIGSVLYREELLTLLRRCLVEEPESRLPTTECRKSLWQIVRYSFVPSNIA